MKKNNLGINTPTTRVCAIYRTPLGCYEILIKSDLFIYSSRRSVKTVLYLKYNHINGFVGV